MYQLILIQYTVLAVFPFIAFLSYYFCPGELLWSNANDLMYPRFPFSSISLRGIRWTTASLRAGRKPAMRAQLGANTGSRLGTSLQSPGRSFNLTKEAEGSCQLWYVDRGSQSWLRVPNPSSRGQFDRVSALPVWLKAHFSVVYSELSTCSYLFKQKLFVTQTCNSQWAHSQMRPT